MKTLRIGLGSLTLTLAIFLGSLAGLWPAERRLAAQILAFPETAAGAPAAERIARMPSAASDQETERVLASLIKQTGWFSEIKASVHDGVVTFDGRAENRDQLDWLAKTVDRLPNVVAVVNKAESVVVPLGDFSPAWKETKRLTEKATGALPTLLMTLALLVSFIFVGRYMKRGVGFLWKKRISNPFLLSTVSRLTVLPIWILFFYLLLQTAGLSSLATTIIGGTGLLGIIFGLAFKGIAENYLAGLLLASRSPFGKGDLIEIESYLGYVQNLNMRGTTIIDLNGNLILIPNSTVIQSVVQNRSANPHTRASFTIGISYRDSINKAQELIVKAMDEVRGVLKDPAPSVLVETFSASAVVLRVMIWFDIHQTNQPRVTSRAMIHTKEVLLANGISFPDGEREVVFAEPLEVRMLEAKGEGRSVSKERTAENIERASENLAESRKHQPPTADPQGEDLLKLAEVNPLPMNVTKKDLLDRE